LPETPAKARRLTLPETPAKAGLFRPTFGFFREIIFNQILSRVAARDFFCQGGAKPLPPSTGATAFVAAKQVGILPNLPLALF